MFSSGSEHMSAVSTTKWLGCVSVHSSPLCQFERWGSLIFGGQGEGVLQELQGKITGHHTMKHKAYFTLYRTWTQTML